MNWRTLLHSTAFGIALVSIGCAQQADPADPRGSDEGSESGDDAALPGDGEGNPGTSVVGACPEDCAQVETPDCYVSVCDAEKGRCKVVPREDGASCDDGLFCTVKDACSAGVCKGGASNDCGQKAATCAVMACDEASKSCIEKPAADGAPCPSTDACTVSATCQAGACVGVPKDCHFAPVPDDCHVSACNPATGACEPVPGNDGEACVKGGDPCMTGKTCEAGVCGGGTPKDCTAASNGCNNGACDAATGACVSQPVAPGGACSEAKDECNAGICDAAGGCKKVPTPGVACASASNTCNAGTCDASGKCVASPINEGKSCDDGNACTAGERCSAGACTGGKAEGYASYLVENFADNARGWALEGDWQIGPAKASKGLATYGYEDPTSDRTATADNGIAGLAIGGYPKEFKHPPQYLVSPPVDTRGTGPLWLSFYRYLNSDYAPYMRNTVEVFDGTQWVSLWDSGGAPGVKDQAWTLMSKEITQYRNAAMQVRFGFEVGDDGSFIVSGWNIDDVVIANAVCDTPAAGGGG
ncbi:hypothetical protein [Polyangium aurulentum]|uniref:hypothetical protein n=1 Tax=Polyangium aurulentum TaxID=2567896 RepID=UPI0010AEC808|nr:hypothetical protein [Polyangium aurulentum]UQA59539.1 hypothetical protein E8A73_003225 [Polyangium aurulentum]